MRLKRGDLPATGKLANQASKFAMQTKISTIANNARPNNYVLTINTNKSSTRQCCLLQHILHRLQHLRIVSLHRLHLHFIDHIFD